MSSPLSGVVSKTILFVRPHYAEERELLSLIKFKLHEAGFIIIHEERRRVNEETADTIAMQLDRAAFLSGGASPSMPSETTDDNNNNNIHRMFTREHATSVPAGPQELVGHVYLYVLARRNCHADLLKFLDRLFADEDLVAVLKSIQARAVHDGGDAAAATTTTAEGKREDKHEGGERQNTWIPCPLFCNATALAAKQAVQLLFPRMLVQEVPNTAASMEYVQAELKGALLPALVELSKAKPENPIRWLAERLLNTNTRAPPLVPMSSVNESS